MSLNNMAPVFHANFWVRTCFILRTGDCNFYLDISQAENTSRLKEADIDLKFYSDVTDN